MKLFILRHGEAEPISSSDRQRELTDRGRQQIRAVVERNSAALAKVQGIFASPYIRTQQTAGEFTEALFKLTGKQQVHQTENVLTPDCSPREVLAFLCSQASDAVLVLISHQPLVSELIAELCEIDLNSISMPTAALASIELDPVGSGFGQLNFID